VTIVFLVFNRREELRESLVRMRDSDYDGEVDVIVVDNASTDGSGDMVREEFPDVRLMAHAENVGVSGWNIGFAEARGDWVLALDDDCYLPPDGLRRAVEGAEQHGADMVSFKVISTHDPDYVFSDVLYRTGLMMFWGCAVLVRRPALRELVGYDPEIFFLANELEFTMRFFDRGYRHLHMPEISAQHMKVPPRAPVPGEKPDMRAYRFNFNHWGYIAGKLMHPRDAVEAVVALVFRGIRDALREERPMITGTPAALRGFVRGLRHREPLRNPAISSFYRSNFESFAAPWELSRSPGEILRSMLPGRARRTAEKRRTWEQYFVERRHLYPKSSSVLDFRS
jgi:GT2 family glycosyltransferase